MWEPDAYSLVLVSAITLLMGYWRRERLILFAAAINVVFIASSDRSFPRRPSSHQPDRIIRRYDPAAPARSALALRASADC